MKPALPSRLALITATLLTAAPVTSWAQQEYPARPIRFIVGFAPGGVADIMARGLALKMAEAYGQSVIIDNRAGAGGTISMQLAAQSAADGYTLLMGSSTQFSINPALRKVPYDPVKDYTPISQVALTPVLLTVHPSMPAKTVKDLMTHAKANPSQVTNFGSTGYGGAPHIAGELFKKTAGLDITHIPYKGGAVAVTELLGGRLHMSFGAVSTSLGHVKAGRLRALGVTSGNRLSAIPDVPTFIESGLPGFEVVQWFGVFAPAGMPAPVVQKLNQTLVKVINMGEVKNQFEAQGIAFTSSSSPELGAYVKTQLARWTRVVKELGIKDEL